MPKRPVVNPNLISCLTQDDMDLVGNYLSHTKASFETGAHNISDIDR
jgi:hypothetical protein